VMLVAVAFAVVVGQRRATDGQLQHLGQGGPQAGQPQLQLGMYPVDDPQALRDPRPDNSYYQSGLNPNNNPSDGSRIIQWGWAPVGLNNPLGLSGLPNTLLGNGQVGTVTIETEN
jgi:hypothetical protein